MGRLTSPLNYLALAVLTFFCLLPVYWLASLSFKILPEWTARPPVWFPASPTLGNYQMLFLGSAEIVPGLKYTINVVTGFFINSLMATGIATSLAVIIGFMAAYALSRYGTGGSFLYLFVLTTRMFPGFGIAIPIAVMFTAVGLFDTQIGLALIYAGVNVAFVLWMMKGFLDDVPREIEEAAMLDGYSTFDVIFKITLPLVKGGLAAAALFVFILCWGEFFFALTLTHFAATTVPVYITLCKSMSGQLYGPLAAMSIIAIIPVVVLGYMIQKHIVRGLTFGAVKGRRG